MTNSEPTPVGPAKWKPCPICGKVLLRGANGSRYHPSGRKCPLADLYMTDRQRRSWNNRDHIGELNKMAAPSHFPTEAEGALIRIREIMAGEGCSAEAVMQMEALLIALPAAPEAGEVERLRAMLSASDDRLRATEMRLIDATNAYRMTRVERDAARDRVKVAEAALAALGEPVVRCQRCDGSGDVHRADGEWVGKCDCAPASAGVTVKQAAQVLLACNGADLDEWTGGLWPDDDATEALAALSQLAPVSGPAMSVHAGQRGEAK